MQVLERFDPDAVAALRARGEFLWLDLTGPTAAEVDEVRRALGLRPAPENLPGMRRRLFEQAEDHAVLVCRDADLVDLVVRPFEVDVVDVPGLEKGARDYLRELADDMGRISEQLDWFASQLTRGVDVYPLAHLQPAHQPTWRLTVVATIFLPLSFVTGFFGQNFGWLVRHVNTLADFLVWGIGGLAVACLLLVIWFRRQRQLP